MFVPGTKGSLNRSIDTDVLLVADATGGAWEVSGDAYDDTIGKYVALPFVKATYRWETMTEQEEIEEIAQCLRTFVGSRQNAKGYVSQYYSWLRSDEQDRKVLEVETRTARAIEILRAVEGFASQKLLEENRARMSAKIIQQYDEGFISATEALAEQSQV